MKALVTGAEGFVGRHLVRHLLEEGDETAATVFDEARPLDERVWTTPCDVRDRDALESVINEFRPQAIYHLAALSYVPDALADPLPTHEVNALGTLNLLEAAARTCPACRVLYVGTSEVYGPRPPEMMPLVEETPPGPNNPYSKSKLAAEKYCADARRLLGLDVVVARPFNHTGPGQDERFVCSSFARQSAEISLGLREPVVEVGNLEARRDFSDVRDVARAYRLLVIGGATGGAAASVYNICSGKAVAIETILEKLLARAGKEVELRCDPARMRPVDTPLYYGSHAKIEKAVGWRPEIDLDRTLGDLFNWWREKLGGR